MNEMRRLVVHLVLLVAAAGFAYVQSRPDDPLDVPLQPGEVDIWGGKPEDVSRVEYSDDRQVVVVERKEDDAGAYYAGRVKPAPAGATPAPSASASAKPPPRPVEAASFVSVKVAEALAKKLAPLRAKRSIGEIDPADAASFGLDEPSGKLVVDVAGVKHSFVLGATTPGATNRYVRYDKDNRVYVIDASVIRDMQGGAGRLAERQQHDWKTAEVSRVTVSSDPDRRELIRSGPEGRRFWADASQPEVNDETAGNWLTKVERLRPISYVDALPEGATKVVRIDYAGDDGKLGFLELHRVDGAKPDYYITTEHVRQPALVAKATGDQVRDDLATLLGRAPPPSDTPEPSPSASSPATAPGVPTAPNPGTTAVPAPTPPEAPAPKAPGAPKAPAPPLAPKGP